MLTTAPVWATAPAIPAPTGKRISVAAPWAILLQSSARSRSTRKSEQRSASTTLAASRKIISKRPSRWRYAIIAFATSRIDWSLAMRRSEVLMGRRSYTGSERGRNRRRAAALRNRLETQCRDTLSNAFVERQDPDVSQSFFQPQDRGEVKGIERPDRLVRKGLPRPAHDIIVERQDI